MVVTKPADLAARGRPTCMPWEVPGYLVHYLGLDEEEARAIADAYSPRDVLEAIRFVKRSQPHLRNASLPAALRSHLKKNGHPGAH